MCPSSIRTCSRAIEGVSSTSEIRYLGSIMTPFFFAGVGARRVASLANQPVKPKNIMVLTTLNKVFALAICRGTSEPDACPPASVATGDIATANSANWGINIIHNKTPITLNNTWTMAARTASTGLPIAANMAVTQVPILAPKASAMPAGRLNKPSLAIAMAIPTVAAEDCTRPVNTAPARTPIIGFFIDSKNSIKGSKVRRGFMASLISPMPKKTRPKPMSIMP